MPAEVGLREGRGMIHEGVAKDRRAEDPSWVMAVAVSVGFCLLSAPLPALMLLFSTLPTDECHPGRCGGGMRAATVVIGLGLLAQIGALVAAGCLRSRSRRAARLLCAVAAPFLPWLAVGAVLL
ncbi:hypothetical protein [Embleya sp. NPDC020886]|uniref:hypothetical protein n=1 Tax=Embleya sp. NPDC020886 TaxID=3363980 RepID=UPI0037A73BE8